MATVPKGKERKNAKCFDDLNIVDKTFIMTYLTNGHNATEAYELTHPNSSYQSAGANASRTKKALQRFIDEKVQERYDELNITADHIIQQLAEMAFAAKEDEIYNAQVKLKALDLMQKQLGLQTKNVKAEAEVSAAVTFVDDLKPDEDQSE